MRSSSVISSSGNRNGTHKSQFITMVGKEGSKQSNIGYNSATKQIFINLASISNARNKPIVVSAQRMKSNSPIQGSLNYVNRKNELQKQIDENIRMLKKIHFVKPTV